MLLFHLQTKIAQYRVHQGLLNQYDYTGEEQQMLEEILLVFWNTKEY